MSVALSTAWVLVDMIRRDRVRAGLPNIPGRVCALDDYLDQIFADGGSYRYEECLGGRAVAKVRASAATITTIVADARVDRIPVRLLDDPVNTMTATQQQTLQTKLLALGYTAAELNARFPLGFAGPYTLREVLQFALGRRFQPRYDAATDAIVLDGKQETPQPPQAVDVAVADG